MKSTEWWLNANYSFFDSDTRGSIALPQHAFIKPFWNPRFLPNNLKSVELPDGYVFCYTQVGIILIPLDHIEEAYD